MCDNRTCGYKGCNQYLMDKRFINKSVYYKAANNIYFSTKSQLSVLDSDLLPTDFTNGSGQLLSYRKIINKFGTSNKNEACKYERLANKIIIFYNNLQLGYNYVNQGKCGAKVKVNWQNNGNITCITPCTAHDMFVYLFSGSSQFYCFFLICCKVQKYILENYKERTNCHEVEVEPEVNCNQSEEFFIYDGNWTQGTCENFYYA